MIFVLGELPPFCCFIVMILYLVVLYLLECAKTNCAVISAQEKGGAIYRSTKVVYTKHGVLPVSKLSSSYSNEG